MFATVIIACQKSTTTGLEVEMRSTIFSMLIKKARIARLKRGKRFGITMNCRKLMQTIKRATKIWPRD
jgi:hypothetical protein